jgi:hypothetical protein
MCVFLLACKTTHTHCKYTHTPHLHTHSAYTHTHTPHTHMHSAQVCQEIIDSEERFLGVLATIIEVYINPLRVLAAFQKSEGKTKPKHMIFGDGDSQNELIKVFANIGRPSHTHTHIYIYLDTHWSVLLQASFCSLSDSHTLSLSHTHTLTHSLTHSQRQFTTSMNGSWQTSRPRTQVDAETASAKCAARIFHT